MLRYDELDTLSIPDLGDFYPVLSVIGIYDIDNFNWHFWVIRDLDPINETTGFNPFGHMRTEYTRNPIEAFEAALDWVMASVMPAGIGVDLLNFYGDDHRCGFNLMTRPLHEKGMCEKKDKRRTQAWPIIAHYEHILVEALQHQNE